MAVSKLATEDASDRVCVCDKEVRGADSPDDDGLGPSSQLAQNIIVESWGDRIRGTFEHLSHIRSVRTCVTAVNYGVGKWQTERTQPFNM